MVNLNKKSRVNHMARLMALFATGELYANANLVTCGGLLSRIREFGGKNENNKY